MVASKLGRFFHERSWIESERNGTERYWNDLTVLGYIVYRLSTVSYRSNLDDRNHISFLKVLNDIKRYLSDNNRLSTVKTVYKLIKPFNIANIVLTLLILSRQKFEFFPPSAGGFVFVYFSVIFSLSLRLQVRFGFFGFVLQ